MALKKDDEEDRIILLNEVDEATISQAIQSLFSLVQKDKKSPISIIVNTFGGSVYDMLALYDVIKYIQNLGTPVNTIGLGKIMSAGVILLISGDVRKIGKNATIMWHWGTSEIAGDMFEMRNELSEMERLEMLCNDILSNETSMSKAEIENLLSPRMDVYITPEEAIKFGMVDDYLETSVPNHKKTITKTKKKTSKRNEK